MLVHACESLSQEERFCPLLVGAAAVHLNPAKVGKGSNKTINSKWVQEGFTAET